MGLLTVRPELQNQHRGSKLLDPQPKSMLVIAVRSACVIGVLHVRDTLIAWYERRGYRATGETEPFPSYDPRVGTPLQENLHFLIMEKPI